MSKSLQQLFSMRGETGVVTGGPGYLGTAIDETRQVPVSLLHKERRISVVMSLVFLPWMAARFLPRGAVLALSSSYTQFWFLPRAMELSLWHFLPSPASGMSFSLPPSASLRSQL